MFFIGATGHLLTLILTVCLPFVFLLTGKQSINISNNSIQIEVQQNQHEFAIDKELNPVFFSDVEISDGQHYKFVPKSTLFKKIPLRNFNAKKDWFCINSCGNKAPPAFRYFC